MISHMIQQVFTYKQCITLGQVIHVRQILNDVEEIQHSTGSYIAFSLI